MLRSSAARTVLGAVLVLIALGLLRYKPWQRASAPSKAPGTTAGTATVTPEGRQKLTVGFLPVT